MYLHKEFMPIRKITASTFSDSRHPTCQMRRKGYSMSLFLWIVGVIVSAFAGLLITVLFQDQISVALVRAHRGFRSNRSSRNLSGNWYSYFVVTSERGASDSALAMSRILTIRLRQVGDKVAGVGVEMSRNYSAMATFQHNYLTGTWQNAIDGRYSWGAFQLHCHSNGDWMAGKFVGKDSNNHINHGIWLWAKGKGKDKGKEGLENAAEWAKGKGYISNKKEFSVRLENAMRKANLGP